MSRSTSKADEKTKRERAKLIALVDSNQASEPKYKGPRFQIVANALHSKTFTGRIDLGTYTEPERKKGRISQRIDELKAEGYQNIDVREIAPEPEEVYE